MIKTVELNRIINRIKCLECGKILESKGVHDFVSCSCNNESFTDGGSDYQRVGGKYLHKIQIWDNKKNEYVNLVNDSNVNEDPTEINKVKYKDNIIKEEKIYTDKELVDMAMSLLAGILFDKYGESYKLRG